ncbi:MAG TPA: hypothetical protein VI032_01965, partial [Burkholderiaceae bacterium]
LVVDERRAAAVADHLDVAADLVARREQRRDVGVELQVTVDARADDRRAAALLDLDGEFVSFSTPPRNAL